MIQGAAGRKPRPVLRMLSFASKAAAQLASLAESDEVHGWSDKPPFLRRYRGRFELICRATLRCCRGEGRLSDAQVVFERR